jgi:hypothetical protein
MDEEGGEGLDEAREELGGVGVEAEVLSHDVEGDLRIGDSRR